MTNRYAIFISILFCIIIGGFFALNIIAPEREISPHENRALAQRPRLTGSSLLSGSYAADYEAYITDQFILRDKWVAAKALMELVSGKHANNGVYFCTKQTLITRFDTPDAERLAQNLNYVDDLAGALDIPVYFSLIPGKASVWAGRLPDGAPNASEAACLELASQAKAGWVDIAAVLNEHADEDVFYRLDHHWTSLGAYYGYTALVEAMGVQPVPLHRYAKATVSQSFTGTEYSASGVRWLPPDNIDIYATAESITVTHGTGAATPGALYDWGKLDGKDQYAFFMGGNTPLAVVRNPAAKGGKVLIIRDSFADSMTPFLAAHFSEVHLYDLRYNRGSVTRYVSDNGIDKVVVLYSVATFVEDTNLFLLAER